MADETKHTKSEASLREERILEFWKENNTFQKSLDKVSPKGEYVFYDGPVTANSAPVLHTMVPFAFKDVVPRYKTMRGYHVRRKGGWDTHGLPVELQIEKKLGLKSKKDIEEYGIAEFNKLCKDSVWEYVGLWKDFTSRMGYWADQENPYVTYHNEYIESLWSVVKKIDEQNLLYKDYRIVPWCPRCGTALSSHELAQGYENVKDLSIYAKFKIIGFDKAYFLAWTTTPWTLPGNVALAVGEDVVYVEAKVGDEILVLAKERLSVITEPYEIIAEHKGKEMVGMKYEPLFPYLSDTIPESEKNKLEKAFTVYVADFVNTTDGTGIVHTAVMYGQDDFVLGTKVGLPKHHLVDVNGNFVKGTDFLEGRFVKEKDDNGKPTLAVEIVDYLTKNNLFFKKENYEHSYPHCWRCKTPLIYYARDSWYIKMSDPRVKGEMIKENKSINWEPSHIREGRFGEWLREIKDWAISRERYWGTPLPVWLSKDGERIIVDSIDTLKKYQKKSGNKYFVMRHGGTEGNRDGVVSYKNQATDNLTKIGEKEVAKAGDNLKSQKIDLIITSDFIRTKETAEVLRNHLGLDKNAVIEDHRLCEINPGDFDGGKWEDYHNHVKSTGPNWFDRTIGGGESLLDVKVRTGAVLYDLEKKYQNKNIVLVTHGGPAWLLFVNTGMFEPDHKEYVPANTNVFVKEFKTFQNAEVRELPFVPLPHDAKYNIDLHRPYIDEVVLEKDGKEFIRTREVMDVWFDSGAMPFAQDHYPFENKSSIDNNKMFPADFISEGIDQTRGWFYTLHAVGVLMGMGKAYKNVICLGHLLDATGKKMSKSVGNVLNPMIMADKYGVDILRFWMYSVNQPGESKNFDEKTVALINQQVFTLLYNVLAFYELYRDKSLENNNRPTSENILDQWILARLDELIKLMTENMDSYKMLEPTRAIRDFIGDLSTWYLRRSRERIKEGEAEAKITLYFVLKTLSKLMAPFAPFTAEDIWQKLKLVGDEESVHLAEWPSVQKSVFSIFKKKNNIVSDMTKVRDIISNLLKERQQKNIPVRQPLAEATGPAVPEVYVEIIKDELNVREYKIGEIGIDTNITPELKLEGSYRELVRGLQDMRKAIGLTPSDVVSISFETNTEGQNLIKQFEADMKKVVGVNKIEFSNNDGAEIKVGELVFKVKIVK